MLKKILEEGHWIGNHTYSHPLNRHMNSREYLVDLERCQEAVFRETNYYPKLHRPPLGRMTIATLITPKRLGLTTMHWSVSAEDWQFRSDDVAVRRGGELADEIVPSDVVLFHDERPNMLRTLDILLPALRERGINLRPDDREFA
jgi:peptidoglycan/xylan/chitin deacetylase (PgdA/CDA1 family)